MFKIGRRQEHSAAPVPSVWKSYRPGIWFARRNSCDAGFRLGSALGTRSGFQNPPSTSRKLA